MSEVGHWKTPEKVAWNQPEYFFPTFEDDQLLFSLPDDDAEIVDAAVVTPKAAEV
jgi:hypothetical protein